MKRRSLIVRSMVDGTTKNSDSHSYNSFEILTQSLCAKLSNAIMSDIVKLYLEIDSRVIQIV